MLEDCIIAREDISTAHPFVPHITTSYTMELCKDKTPKPSDIEVFKGSNDDLKVACFPESFSLETGLLESSIAKLAGLIDDQTEPTSNSTAGTTEMHRTLSLKSLRDVSIQASARATNELDARGRAKQRWAIDPRKGLFMRLVAGCVPILNDGRIVLISSSKGKGWLIPKGGWDTDEILEEGAIRECYEEAGVTGILGPKLEAVRMETKKAKKLRLELEEKSSKQKLEATGPESKFYSGWSVLSQLSEDENIADGTSYTSEEAYKHSPIIGPERVDSPTTLPPPPPMEGEKTAVRVTFQLSNGDEDSVECNLNHLIPATESMRPEETVQTGSTSSLTHTHTCTSFFPLYVQEIHDVWPEQTRGRQAFHIDEAIKVIRPEFRPFLEKIKARGLHLTRNKR